MAPTTEAAYERVRRLLRDVTDDHEARIQILSAVIDYGLAMHAEAISAWQASLNRHWPRDLQRREAEMTGDVLSDKDILEEVGGRR